MTKWTLFITVLVITLVGLGFSLVALRRPDSTELEWVAAFSAALLFAFGVAFCLVGMLVNLIDDLRHSGSHSVKPEKLPWSDHMDEQQQKTHERPVVGQSEFGRTWAGDRKSHRVSQGNRRK